MYGLQRVLGGLTKSTEHPSMTTGDLSLLFWCPDPKPTSTEKRRRIGSAETRLHQGDMTPIRQEPVEAYEGQLGSVGVYCGLFWTDWEPTPSPQPRLPWDAKTRTENKIESKPKAWFLLLLFIGLIGGACLEDPSLKPLLGLLGST